MNAQSQAPVAGGKTGKLILQMVLGGVSGALAMIGIITVIGDQKVLLNQPGGLEALTVAMVYVLMAAVIGLGVMAPRVGAKALNVEDAEEIGEQRTDLVVGAITFLLVGVLLGALALAGRPGVEGLLSPPVALTLAGGASGGLLLLSILYRKRGDEMMRKVSLEAGNWALGFVILLFGGWAALAHLGTVPPVAPLQFVAGLFALYLVAIFIAAGRRGMLKTR